MIILDKKIHECFVELGYIPDIPDIAFLSMEPFISMVQNVSIGSRNYDQNAYKQIQYISAYGMVNIRMDIDLTGWDAYIGPYKDWIDEQLIEKIFLRNKDETFTNW